MTRKDRADLESVIRLPRSLQRRLAHPDRYTHLRLKMVRRLISLLRPKPNLLLNRNLHQKAHKKKRLNQKLPPLQRRQASHLKSREAVNPSLREVFQRLRYLSRRHQLRKRRNHHQSLLRNSNQRVQQGLLKKLQFLPKRIIRDLNLQ